MLNFKVFKHERSLSHFFVKGEKESNFLKSSGFSLKKSFFLGVMMFEDFDYKFSH